MRKYFSNSEAAERIVGVLLAASKDARLGAFIFIPAEYAPNHARKALLLPFSAKLNLYFERGIIPQKGSFMEYTHSPLYWLKTATLEIGTL